MEAREMKAFVTKIQKGSSLDKAANLRKVAQDIDKFPATNILARECLRYFEKD